MDDRTSFADTAAGRFDPTARRARALAHRWRRGAVIAGGFTLLAVVNTYPLAFTPASAIGLHGDAFFSVWRLAWVAHQLRTDPLHLFDANIFYPEKGTLAYSDAMLLPAVVLAPLHWVGMDPVAVYNLVLIGTFVLNALAAYLLVSRLTRSRVAGVLGGVIYAFSPYRFEHFDHLELQFAFWIPLAVLAWHRALATEGTRDFLLVAACVAGQVLSCIYYAAFLFTWLGVLTAAWFVRSPRRMLKAGAVALVPPAIVFAIYSIPYLAARQQLGDRSVSDLAFYSATALDFLSTPASNVLYGWTEQVGGPERRLFPGIIAAVLLVVGLWRPFSSVRLLHAGGMLLALLLVIGLNGPIYGLLYEHVLPFRGLRVPARATILLLLGTSVLAGFGLARLRARLAHRPRLAALAAVMLVAGASAEYVSRPGLRTLDRQVSPWYAWLGTIPDAVVFEWPVTVPWRIWHMMDVDYMHRSTLHWRPLVNGYSGHYPRSYIELLLRVRSFPDTGSLEYLKGVGVNVLVVHEPSWGGDTYTRALERLTRDPHVSVIAHSRDAGGGRVAFFRLEGGPPLPPRP